MKSHRKLEKETECWIQSNYLGKAEKILVSKLPIVGASSDAGITNGASPIPVRSFANAKNINLISMGRENTADFCQELPFAQQ